MSAIKSFRTHIRLFRVEHDLNQKEMAAMLKISSSQLCAIENGRRRIPDWFVTEFMAKMSPLTDGIDRSELQQIVAKSNLEFGKQCNIGHFTPKAFAQLFWSLPKDKQDKIMMIVADFDEED